MNYMFKTVIIVNCLLLLGCAKNSYSSNNNVTYSTSIKDVTQLKIDIEIQNLNYQTQKSLDEKVSRRLICIDEKSKIDIIDYFKEMNENHFIFEVELCEGGNVNTCPKQPIPHDLQLQCYMHFSKMFIDFNYFETKKFDIRLPSKKL